MTRNLILLSFILLYLNSCKKDPAPVPDVPVQPKPPVNDVIGSYRGQVVKYYFLYENGITKRDTSYYEAVQIISLVESDSFKYQPDSLFRSLVSYPLMFTYKYIQGKDSTQLYQDYDGLNGYANGIRVKFPTADSLIGDVYSGYSKNGIDRQHNWVFRGKRIK